MDVEENGADSDEEEAAAAARRLVDRRRLHVVAQVAHLEIGRHGVRVGLLHEVLLLAVRQIWVAVATGLLVSLGSRRQPGLERHIHA